MKLQAITIRNFKSLLGVKLEALQGLTCLTGDPGTGKSSFLDALEFIQNVVNRGATVACDLQGGFERLVTQDVFDAIGFELTLDDDGTPYTYAFQVVMVNGIPVIAKESLSNVFDVTLGKGTLYGEPVQLSDVEKPALSVFGNLAKNKEVVRVKKYLSSWYHPRFDISAMRALQADTHARLLSRNGDNLAGIFRDACDPSAVMRLLSEFSPGIKEILPISTEDRKLLLRFEEDYARRFFQAQMAEGTLFGLAYALLLADPNSPPLMTFKEPGTGLAAGGVRALAKQMTLDSGRSQMFVTSNNPTFFNEVEAVFKFEKGKVGTKVSQ